MIIQMYARFTEFHVCKDGGGADERDVCNFDDVMRKRV